MWKKPVVEFRVEEYERGTLPKLLDIYKRTALPAYERNVGRPLAFYTSIVGRQNCLIQLWGYDSVAAYEEGRAAVEADPLWAEYLRAAEGVVLQREARLTRRVGFPIVDQAPNESHSKPVVDFRTYTIRYNNMPKFLSTSEEFALEVMLRHIGSPLGYYIHTVGNLQQVTHLWGYDGMGDMEIRRKARNADPQWKNYLNASDGIYERQETQLLARQKVFDDE
jgi:hypothetical protein